MVKTQNSRSSKENRYKAAKKWQGILYAVGFFMVLLVWRSFANNSHVISQIFAFASIATFGLGSLIKSSWSSKLDKLNVYVMDRDREALRRKFYGAGVICAVIAGFTFNSGAQGPGVFFVIVGDGALLIAGLMPIKWLKRAEGGCYTFHEFFNPENVTIIVSLVTTAIGVTTTAIKGIKLWMDERKSRKIKIKYQDIELEISGPISEDEINKKLAIFKRFKQEIKNEDVSILLLDK